MCQGACNCVQLYCCIALQHFGKLAQWPVLWNIVASFLIAVHGFTLARTSVIKDTALSSNAQYTSPLLLPLILPTLPTLKKIQIITA